MSYKDMFKKVISVFFQPIKMLWFFFDQDMDRLYKKSKNKQL
jgi:hypothetical protein